MPTFRTGAGRPFRRFAEREAGRAQPFVSALLNRNGATSRTPGGRLDRKGHRAADRHGGEADARRQKPVEHAFAEPRGKFRGDAMAEELLHEAVARPPCRR